MFKFIGLASFLVVFLVSCGGASKDVPNNNTAPTNLNVQVQVATDSSGNVSFVATATNAVSFDFDFGNGTMQTVPSGSIVYKYPLSGNYTVTVTAKSSGAQTAAKTIQVVVGVKLNIVWSEEFDSPGVPNSAKWGYDIGEGGWGNSELQNYTNRSNNSIVSNGTLKIIATREPYGTSAFTSARLLSKDKFSFKYGKIEVRAKLPANGGTWPAIWMLGSNISSVSWPACGEIDIMEHKGNDLNKIYGTIHYPNHSGGSAVGGTTIITGASTDFHRYAAIWSDASIQFLVDDTPFFTVANNNTMPFNQNFFIILNLAMGGTFGGAVDPAFTTAQMEVDYVRVYQ